MELGKRKERAMYYLDVRYQLAIDHQAELQAEAVKERLVRQRREDGPRRRRRTLGRLIQHALRLETTA